MKIKFTDGYIETSSKGNTICGNVAHELYRIANETARELKLDNQWCLHNTIKEYNKIKKTA